MHIFSLFLLYSEDGSIARGTLGLAAGKRTPGGRRAQSPAGTARRSRFGGRAAAISGMEEPLLPARPQGPSPPLPLPPRWMLATRSARKGECGICAQPGKESCASSEAAGSSARPRSAPGGEAEDARKTQNAPFFPSSFILFYFFSLFSPSFISLFLFFSLSLCLPSPPSFGRPEGKSSRIIILNLANPHDGAVAETLRLFLTRRSLQR